MQKAEIEVGIVAVHLSKMKAFVDETKASLRRIQANGFARAFDFDRVPEMESIC